jgi:hypothetical protein
VFLIVSYLSPAPINPVSGRNCGFGGMIPAHQLGISPRVPVAVGLQPVFVVNPAATNLGLTDASAIDQFPLLYNNLKIILIIELGKIFIFLLSKYTELKVKYGTLKNLPCISSSDFHFSNSFYR